jgi:hypothetical protein
VLAMLAVSLSGCQQINPSSSYAPQLQADYNVAKPMCTTQPSAATAKAFLPVAKTILNRDYAQATVFLPSWIFDSSKGLFVTTTAYNIIRNDSLHADIYATGANLTDADAIMLAEYEAAEIVDFLNTSLGR